MKNKDLSDQQPCVKVVDIKLTVVSLNFLD